MANDYSQAIKQAQADIQLMIDKMNQLEQEVVSSLKNITKGIKETQGASNPKNVANNIDKQTESVNRLNKAYSALTSAEKKVLSDSNRLLATRKSLAAQKQKEAASITKANKARVREADMIERNKQALLKQKAASEHLSRAYVKLVAAQQKSKKVLQDLIAGGKANRRQIRAAQKDYDKLTRKVNKANKATSNFAKGGLGGMARGFQNLLGAFGIMAGTQMIGQLIGNIFNLTKEINSIDFAMKAVIKESSEFGQTQSWLIDITQRYGAELITTSKRYTKFRAAAMQAGLSAKETQKIFGTMTKAAGVLGLKTDELTGVYLALEQMISKGKITTEELRRQLGERLPGAMDIMAKSMNVSTAELDKMMKKGLVITKDVLPAFAEQLEKAYGIENVRNVKTLVASQTRLGNSWKLLVAEIERGNGAISTFFMGALDLSAKLISNLTELQKAQSKLGDAGVEGSWWDLLKKISFASRMINSEYDELIEKQKKFNKQLAFLDGKSLQQIASYYDEISVASEGATGKTKKMYDGQKKSLLKIMNYRALTISSLRKEALVLGWVGELYEENGNIIKNTYSDIRDMSDEELHRFLDANRKKKDAEEGFAKGSIEWLDEMISANNELIKQSNDRTYIEKIQEENKLLEQQKDLLLEGARARREMIETSTKGIDEKLIKEESILDSLNNQIKALQELKQKSNDTNEVAKLTKQIELYGTLKKAIETGDYSIFSDKDTDVVSSFLDVLEGVNYELARHVRVLIEAAKESGNFKTSMKMSMEESMLYIADMVTTASDILGGLSDQRIQNIEREQEALEKKYDKQKELIKNEIIDEKSKKVRLDQLEKQRKKEKEKADKKIAKEKNKQAKIDKAAAIFQIGINTAIGMMKAFSTAVTVYDGAVMAALVLAMGLAQTAAVQSQALPAYAQGGEHTQGGFAIVGDGGRHEAAVLPSGEVWKTPKSDTVVDLPKGTHIYPDFNKFQSDSEKMREMAWAMSLEYNFASQPKKQDNFSKDLRKDVMKSLSGLTINNHSHEVAQAVKDAINESSWTNNFL